MKKITLLKDYLGSKPGDTIDRKAGIANYLIKIGVAKEVEEEETPAPEQSPPPKRRNQRNQK